MNLERDLANMRERLAKAHETATAWKAIAWVISQENDMLRRELDNLEKDNEDRKERAT